MKLPTVVSSEVSESHALLEIVANPELIYFQGHFTDDAILPGVVQVGWAVEFASSLFRAPVSASGLRKIKFNHIIRPSQPLRLQLDLDRERNRLKYRYTGASSDDQNDRQTDARPIARTRRNIRQVKLHWERIDHVSTARADSRVQSSCCHR